MAADDHGGLPTLISTSARSVQVMVGCECKTCNTPGGCTLRVGSVDMTFHLGTTQDGLSAGDLSIHSKEIGADVFKRAAVQLSTLDTGAEGVSDKQGLRQVVTPSTFVQIEDSPSGGYELSFYPPSVKTSDEKDPVKGLYPVELTNVDALAKWRVFDPGPGQGGAKRLRVEETRTTGTRNHDYEWNAEAHSWSLTEGDGLRKELRTEQELGNLRVERTTISDSTGAVASVVERTYEKFDWGESITKEVRDPDGVALTTVTGYYENPDDPGSFGQIQYQIEPDGNWVRYSYDDHRRITTEQRPWLDSPSDTFSGLPSQGRVTQYSYAPVVGWDVASGNADDEQQMGFTEPRVTAERITGTLVALTYRAIRNAGSSGREDVEERCPSQGSSFGDGSCLRTTTTYYPENHGAADGGKLATVISPDGKMDSYSYERGTWNGSAFSTGDGNAIRTTLTHGTQNSPQGIADKTTREVSIVDELGRAVRDERYIYVGGGHVLVSWTDRQYDALGHLIRTVSSAGEEERASWGCCTQDSSTDSRGTKTVYERDALQRVRSSTRAGVTTTYAYDAEGRVLQTTRSGGGLSLTSSNQYDGVGRPIASIDEGGLSTSHGYTLGGRITTTTHPGGFTEVSEQHLDGQSKSVTGDRFQASAKTWALGTGAYDDVGAAKARGWTTRPSYVPGRRILLKHVASAHIGRRGND
jgi:YD repeat-containing protein